MDTTHIHKQLDSDTVPELKPWIGKRVEIYVFESSRPAPASVHVAPPPFSTSPIATIEELAAQQGIELKTVEELRGGWPADELNDGFEDALKSWREQEIAEELERRSRK